MTETTVHQAWANVMHDVRALGKNSTNNYHRYNFRGIDDVMNAVGPVLRDHHVAVVPTNVDTHYRDVRTSKDKPARECTVLVTFTVYGPAGDSFPIAAPGESMDEGDKGTAKAMSVAMRVALLQALCLPTDERDPDADSYERGQQQEQPPPSQQETAQKVADGLPNVSSLQKLAELEQWSEKRALLNWTVADQSTGEGTKLSALIERRRATLENQAGEAA